MDGQETKKQRRLLIDHLVFLTGQAPQNMLHFQF
jgi:hypothetical protein